MALSGPWAHEQHPKFPEPLVGIRISAGNADYRCIAEIKRYVKGTSRKGAISSNSRIYLKPPSFRIVKARLKTNGALWMRPESKAKPRAPTYLMSRLPGYVPIGYIGPRTHYLVHWSPK